jgi:hypothetical protein
MFLLGCGRTPRTPTPVAAHPASSLKRKISQKENKDKKSANISNGNAHGKD